MSKIIISLILIVGASCTTPSQQIVPRATCTSQPFLRRGEVHGCTGWTKSIDGTEEWGRGEIK